MLGKQPSSIVSGPLNSTNPYKINRKFADSVPAMPGSDILKAGSRRGQQREAPESGTLHVSRNRQQFGHQKADSRCNNDHRHEAGHQWRTTVAFCCRWLVVKTSAYTFPIGINLAGLKSAPCDKLSYKLVL